MGNLTLFAKACLNRKVHLCGCGARKRIYGGHGRWNRLGFHSAIIHSMSSPPTDSSGAADVPLTTRSAM